MPDKLKKGWRTWRFDQMAVMVNDRIDNPSEAGVDRYVGLEHLDSDSLTIRRWGAPTDVEATKLRFRAGEIIFGRRRVYQRKLGVPEFDGICSAHAMVLRARPEVALPEFLPLFMQSDLFMERAKQISVGSLSPTINWKTLAAEEFALPPLEDQRRIAELGRALQNVVEAFSAATDAARLLLSSLEKRHFIEKPDGCQRTLSQCGDIRNGTTPRRNRADYWGGNVPWLPTGKVNDRRILAADEHITKKALAECSLSIIPRGATLVAMIGEGQTRGRAAFLAIDACVNQNFAAVVPGAGVDSQFLFFLLEMQYEALRHWSQGTNQHALNCKLVGSFPVRVPSLDRQREIATVLMAADSAMESAATREKGARDLLKKWTEQTLGGGEF